MNYCVSIGIDKEISLLIIGNILAMLGIYLIYLYYKMYNEED